MSTNKPFINPNAKRDRLVEEQRTRLRQAAFAKWDAKSFTSVYANEAVLLRKQEGTYRE